MPFLLSILGFGKELFSVALDILKSIFQFALKKPVAFAAIVLALLLAAACWNLYTTRTELSRAKETITAQSQAIKSRDVLLKQYVKALDEEKQTLRRVIDTNNKAVDELKKAADSALTTARKEAEKAEKKRLEYIALADKYKNVNPSTGSAEERIAREEKTTDEFIGDWEEAK